MAFILMTDSSCNLPAATIAQFGLPIVPTPFYGKDGESRSTLSDDFDGTDFYRRMEAGEEFKTSLINYAACEEFIKPVLEASNDDLLYISISSGLTTSFDVVSAYLKEQKVNYPGRRLVAVDSLSVCLGMGLLVYKAAQMREAGASFDEVETWVRENSPHACHWFTVSDLKYLVRGGRLSGASAAVATVLDIKPVMHVDDEGKLMAVSKVRGRKKSLQALVDAFGDKANEPYVDQDVFIAHGGCEADAQFIADAIRERYGVQRFLLNIIDPVVGAHSGPGTIALFFFGEPR